MNYLTEVQENKTVVVQQIDGGHGVVKKLESLGLRKGCVIKKVSPKSFKGPVVIEFLNSKSQLAIGFGVAKKILVSEK